MTHRKKGIRAVSDVLDCNVLLVYVCIEEKVQEIMTADERQKLYDAIGYEENKASDLPKEVCLFYFIF